MAVQALLIPSKTNFLFGFETFLKENSIDLNFASSVESIPSTMVKNNVELVVYAGDMQDESFVELQKISKHFPNTPVLIISPHTPAQYGVEMTSMVGWVFPLSAKSQFLKVVNDLLFAKKISEKALSQEPRREANMLQRDFFNTIEINEVLDLSLAHFGSKVLCSNIHWIQWSELQHLSEADEESLKLEVETKYHRTPRLRSLNKGSLPEIVELVRSFPLKKKLPFLTQGGHLVQKLGNTQHLLFPIRESAGKKNIACLLVEDLHDGDAAFIVQMMQGVLKNLVRHIEFGYQLYDAKNLSFTDDLTDLYNQRYLPQVIDNEIARARRACAKFSVLFMDLDHFKRVNDTKGHWVGSKLLVEVGKLVKGSIRSCDYGFRYGGDEYVVILVDTDVKGAEVVGERLREQIENTEFLVDGHEVQLTVSVGVACFPDHADSRGEIIKMADEAMYQGKHKSRNIVYVAS